jgi:hypothetical protein
MTAFWVRGRAPWRDRKAARAVWAAAALLLSVIAAPAFADEPFIVPLDQARLMKFPDRAATVVVGNPLIADLTIQPGGIAVITGKGFGSTNFIVMDRGGAVLLEKTVEVTGPKSEPVVMVFRGPTRQSYSCTPDCSPRITLGDTSKDDADKESQLNVDYFNRTLNATMTRNAQAMAIGSGSR